MSQALSGSLVVALVAAPRDGLGVFRRAQGPVDLSVGIALGSGVAIALFWRRWLVVL